MVLKVFVVILETIKAMNLGNVKSHLTPAYAHTTHMVFMITFSYVKGVGMSTENLLLSPGNMNNVP